MQRTHPSILRDFVSRTINLLRGLQESLRHKRLQCNSLAILNSSILALSVWDMGAHYVPVTIQIKMFDCSSRALGASSVEFPILVCPPSIQRTVWFWLVTRREIPFTYISALEPLFCCQTIANDMIIWPVRYSHGPWLQLPRCSLPRCLRSHCGFRIEHLGPTFYWSRLLKEHI